MGTDGSDTSTGRDNDRTTRRDIRETEDTHTHTHTNCRHRTSNYNNPLSSPT